MSVKIQLGQIIGKQSMVSALFLVFGLLSLGARAGLSEPTGPAPNPDYFNLWENSVTSGSGSGSLTGDLTSSTDSVWLCGTENCSGAADGADTGYAESNVDYAAPAGETMLIDGDVNQTLMLDINEPDTTSTLGPDELSYFIATTDGDLSFDTSDEPDVGSRSLATGDFNQEEEFEFGDMGWDEAYAELLADNLDGSADSGDFDTQATVPVTMELQDFVNSRSGDDLFVYLYDFTGSAADVCGIDGSVCSQTEEFAYFLDPSGGWVYMDDEVNPRDPGVPVPSTVFLFGLGGLLIWRQRRKS